MCRKNVEWHRTGVQGVYKRYRNSVEEGCMRGFIGEFKVRVYECADEKTF